MRWVIYARKSSEDSNKQTRSIKDQVQACEELAKREGYNVVKVFQENKSAKRSGRRPEFNKMIQGFMAKEYDGIISWAPDRLSRNMKEAGELIDMLDNNIISNLNFAAHAFVNDYNGIMTLGISFVISKQYSDRLSHVVKRGMHRKFNEGKYIGRFVHGYQVDGITDRYEPDETQTPSGETHFEIIKQAFDMRINGKTLNQICKYVNEKGYVRKTKQSKKVQKMTEGKLSKMFKDSIYYGTCQLGENEVDLVEIHGFTPMISKREYEMLQDYKPTGNSERKLDWPFLQVVRCGDCLHAMSAGASKSRSGKRYLYYWCTNKECHKKRAAEGKPKSPTIRAKHIIAEFKRCLKEITIDEDLYKDYKEHFDISIFTYKQELTSKVRSVRRALNSFEELRENLELKKIHDGSEWSKSEQETYKKQIRHYNKKINQLEHNIEELNKAVPKKVDFISFLNHLKTASTRFSGYNIQKMDKIVQNVFLNLIVKEGEVVSVSYKEPFHSMQRLMLMSSGAPERT